METCDRQFSPDIQCIPLLAGGRDRLETESKLDDFPHPHMYPTL
ncbi:hypothetical protein APA_4106 [Pseudanabaena sp. lw0831]|nr:hypothetical protein APA_4106 [Pseudanabaena sp. lw0831]